MLIAIGDTLVTKRTLVGGFSEMRQSVRRVLEVRKAPGKGRVRGPAATWPRDSRWAGRRVTFIRPQPDTLPERGRVAPPVDMPLDPP